MSNAAKKRLRKDLLLIGSLAIGFVALFIVLRLVDDSGELTQSWATSFYDFVLRR